MFHNSDSDLLSTRSLCFSPLPPSTETLGDHLVVRKKHTRRTCGQAEDGRNGGQSTSTLSMPRKGTPECRGPSPSWVRKFGGSDVSSRTGLSSSPISIPHYLSHQSTRDCAMKFLIIPPTASVVRPHHRCSLLPLEDLQCSSTAYVTETT